MKESLLPKKVKMVGQQPGSGAEIELSKYSGGQDFRPSLTSALTNTGLALVPCRSTHRCGFRTGSR